MSGWTSVVGRDILPYALLFPILLSHCCLLGVQTVLSKGAMLVAEVRLQIVSNYSDVRVRLERSETFLATTFLFEQQERLWHPLGTVQKTRVCLDRPYRQQWHFFHFTSKFVMLHRPFKLARWVSPSHARLAGRAKSLAFWQNGSYVTICIHRTIYQYQ